MRKIDKEAFLHAKLLDFQHIFESTKLVYEHAPDRGGPREKAVLDYFKNHLPRKYGVTTGKILNNSGDLTRQIDVIIYDALNCPILYSENIGEEYQIIPSESVIGTIEVKSTLNNITAKEILTNIDSILEVTNRSEILTSFFCYSPPIFGEQSEIDKFCQNMQNIFSNDKYKKTLKIGCVLPNKKNTIRGRIMNAELCFFFMRQTVTLDKTITKGKEKVIHNFPVFLESEPEVLLSSFISVLSDELNKWRPKKYSIFQYIFQFGKKSEE